LRDELRGSRLVKRQLTDGDMRRKLSDGEKSQLRGERLERERRAFPAIDIDVIVEDFTWANGEPIIRVISHGAKDKDP
jgi:hypothetical protein